MCGVYPAQHNPTASPANRRSTHAPIDLSAGLVVWRGLGCQSPVRLERNILADLRIAVAPPRPPARPDYVRARGRGCESTPL